MSLTTDSVTVPPVSEQTGTGKRSGRKSGGANWQLYLMLLPGLIMLLVFGYGPLFGLIIAFQDFSPFKGVFRSPWVGFENFQTAFKSPFFWQAFRNSVTISGLKLLVGFPTAIILALLLNEVRFRWFKRIVQTGTILPFCISWVVVSTMFQNLLAPEGVINGFLKALHLAPVSFLSNPSVFLWVIVLQDTWKYAGYFAVIYLAAITAIDPTLYEAAIVDGANRWRQTWYITLPGITATMITLFILLTGYLVSAGFEQVYVMYNQSVYQTADIIETFTLRTALQQGDYATATAIGMFQSVISLSLVMLANFLTKRISKKGLF